MIDWLRQEHLNPEITLGDQLVPIVLKRHPRATRLTLRLAPDGTEVRITLPRWARSQEAIAFAHARHEWLQQQMDRIPSRAEPAPGECLMYRGESYRIDWDETAPRRPQLSSKTVAIGGPLNAIERRLRTWLEREALEAFQSDVEDYCGSAKLPIAPVSLSRAQKRWGSCSDKQRIRVNWRLIQAPDFVRRSVVAHEVAHLVHFDHSPAFHALLATIYEGDVKQADAWLKQNGRTLYSSFG